MTAAAWRTPRLQHGSRLSGKPCQSVNGYRNRLLVLARDRSNGGKWNRQSAKFQADGAIRVGNPRRDASDGKWQRGRVLTRRTTQDRDRVRSIRHDLTGAVLSIPGPGIRTLRCVEIDLLDCTTARVLHGNRHRLRRGRGEGQRATTVLQRHLRRLHGHLLADDARSLSDVRRLRQLNELSQIGVGADLLFDAGELNQLAGKRAGVHRARWILILQLGRQQGEEIVEV
jgi:hypothetical protein